MTKTGLYIFFAFVLPCVAPNLLAGAPAGGSTTSPPKGTGVAGCGIPCQASLTLTLSAANPAQPVANLPFTINYKLSNVSKTMTFGGEIQAEFQGKVVGDRHNATPGAVRLAPSTTRSGSLLVAQPAAGGSVLTVTFCATGNVSHVPLQPPCKASGPGAINIAATAAIQVQTDDADADGVPDALENKLLARFSPYLLFSNDNGQEQYAPADAALYITRSELRKNGSETDDNDVAKPNSLLATNPQAVLFDSGPAGPSNLLKAPALSDYHINPLASIPGSKVDNPGRHGNDWPSVLSKRNIGLYGHVIPVMMNDPYGFSLGLPKYQPYTDCPADQDRPLPTQARLFYKIEYWQFFGFNETQKAQFGDHEGDWTTVQLVYDPQNDVVTSVMHFAHGIGFRFDITPQANARTAHFSVPEGDILEIRSCNFFKYGGDINLASFSVNDDFSIVINDDQVAHAQNNIVRMLAEKGKTTHDHPVVYVENGSHEFFPTQAWKFYGAPNHNGKGFHYLAATPPNLGEIDHPLSDTSMGAVITQYNGYWGTYGFHNTPPQGPPLHSEWTAVPGSPAEKLLQAIRRGG